PTSKPCPSGGGGHADDCCSNRQRRLLCLARRTVVRPGPVRFRRPSPPAAPPAGLQHHGQRQLPAPGRAGPGRPRAGPGAAGAGAHRHRGCGRLHRAGAGDLSPLAPRQRREHAAGGCMNLLPGLVMLPLCAALAAMLLPPRWRGPLALVLALGMAAAALDLLREVVGAGPQVHALGGWAAPLGIALKADGLAAGMVVLSAAVALPCTLHAALGLRGEGVEDAFWPLFWFLWAALNGIWLSADLFNLYVGLELLGLAAVGLVALKGSAGALAAAMRYLLAALLGSLAYLIGVAL